MSTEDQMDDGTPIRLAVTVDRRDGSAVFDFEGGSDGAGAGAVFILWAARPAVSVFSLGAMVSGTSLVHGGQLMRCLHRPCPPTVPLYTPCTPPPAPTSHPGPPIQTQSRHRLPSFRQPKCAASDDPLCPRSPTYYPRRHRLPGVWQHERAAGGDPFCHHLCAALHGHPRHPAQPRLHGTHHCQDSARLAGQRV